MGRNRDYSSKQFCNRTMKKKIAELKENFAECSNFVSKSPFPIGSIFVCLTNFNRGKSTIDNLTFDHEKIS